MPISHNRFAAAVSRPRVLSLLAALCSAVVFFGGGPRPGFATTVDADDVNVLAPAITTDRNDYSPGETVTIAGFNFLPGETVTIAVAAPRRPDRFVVSVADASGRFTNTDFSPDEGDRRDFLKAVATGSRSGRDRVAVAYFYDATPFGPCPYVVDASLAASNPAASLFKTIQEAVTALPNPGPCLINIKAAPAGTTYSEAVVVDGVNSAAGATAASEIVIQADPDNTGPVIVTAPGPQSNTTTSYALSFQKSRFVTVSGLALTGSARAGIRLRGEVSPRNSDITIAGNEITSNNATAAAVTAGIDVGSAQTRIWIANNLIRANGRMGIDVASPNTAIYIVNNTIAGNVSGGVNVVGAAGVTVLNNLVVGNGTAPSGAVGSCACGLVGGNSASSLTLRNNLFYRNGNATSGFTDIKDAANVLDATDAANYVTCTGADTGCTTTSLGGVGGCVFSDCLGTHVPAGEIFVSDTDFRLKSSPPQSPAIDRGLNSFQDPPGGLEWVPVIDFDGAVRPLDGDGVGGATVDIGFVEAASVLASTTTAVTGPNGNTSSFGALATFTATVTSGAVAVPAGSGTVTFYLGLSCGGSQVGSTQSLGAGGKASVGTSALAVGVHTITACYSGLAGAFTSSSGSVVHTVGKADQTITVTQHAPPTAVFGTSFTVAATGGGSGQPVLVGAAGACSATGNTITMTSGTGTCAVTFDQAGNANYSAAPQVQETTTAQKTPQTITVTAGAPASAVYKTSFTVAAAGGGSGLPVTVGASGVCSASGNTITMTSGTGTCTVTFDQAGDTNYLPAPQVTQSTTAAKATQTIAFDALPTRSYGDPAFGVAATASSGLTVTFSSLTPATCGVSVNTVTILHSGQCTVRAAQAGNADYQPAPTVDQTFGINMGPAVLWLGLRNSDDQSTQFDVRVEVYSGSTLVASGEKRCIAGVTRNAALEVAVPLTGYATGPVTVAVLTRIGTNADSTKCAGHGSATGLGVYYDASNRPSRIGDTPLYLRTTGAADVVNTTAPVGTAPKRKDSAGIKFVGGNAWKPVGTTWPQQP